MPSGLYRTAVESFMKGGVNLLLDTLKVVLVDSNQYTPDLASNQFLSVFPPEAEVGTPVSLTGRTVANGAFKADTVTFSGASAVTAEYVVIYREMPLREESPLIAIFDAYPVAVLDGKDVKVLWPVDGIIKV